VRWIWFGKARPQAAKPNIEPAVVPFELEIRTGLRRRWDSRSAARSDAELLLSLFER
jgi:hypothetical protein